MRCEGRSSVVEQWPFKPKVVGSIPTAPTNNSFAGKGLQFPREQLGNSNRSLCRFCRGKHHSNDFAVCFAQRLGNCLGVDVHRGANICVPQQFLLNLNVHFE